jgi:hypothetical protein
MGNLKRKQAFLAYLLKLDGQTDVTKRLIEKVKQEIAEMSKEKEHQEVDDENSMVR